ILRPGGTFLCSTPNRAVTNPGTAINQKPFNPFHVREYTRAELHEALAPFFSSVTIYGQSFYRKPYVCLLGVVGRAIPMLAVRLHQARKLLGMPFEHPARHEVRQLVANAEPEILIACCER